MPKKKQVQIDFDIYNMIYKYFCEEAEVDTYAICNYLADKQRKLEQHSLYSASCNQKLPEDVRNAMRAEYEESAGIPKKFRRY